MKTLKWAFVYSPKSEPIAAFSDRALAEAYVEKSPELQEAIVTRTFTLGGESTAVRLLRDIVSNDYTTAGDQRMQKAINEARIILKISA